MRAYATTDVGRVRRVNQDYIFCSMMPVGKLPNLFIVAEVIRQVIWLHVLRWRP